MSVAVTVRMAGISASARRPVRGWGAVFGRVRKVERKGDCVPVSCIIHRAQLGSRVASSCAPWPLYLGRHTTASHCHGILDICLFFPTTPYFLFSLYLSLSPFYFRFALSPDAASHPSLRSFPPSPSLNFACHETLCAASHASSPATMSHKFDNSAAGASFMRVAIVSK